MHSIDLLRLFTLLFAGVLAGFEMGVHYGLGTPPKSLREDAQILLRQAMVLRLRVLAPAIFLPTLATVIALMVREGDDRGVWLRSIALGALATWVVFRVLRTVPVNSATLTWQPDAPPDDWRTLIRTTEKAHVLAAWAALLAFACLLAATLQ
jgi:hypothetical protein